MAGVWHLRTALGFEKILFHNPAADSLSSYPQNSCQQGGIVKLRIWMFSVVCVAIVVVSSAQAQTVSFLNVNDAVPGKYFDSAATVVDPGNSNRLIIGFNTG